SFNETKLRIRRRLGGVPRSSLHGKEFPTASITARTRGATLPMRGQNRDELWQNAGRCPETIARWWFAMQAAHPARKESLLAARHRHCRRRTADPRQLR